MNPRYAFVRGPGGWMVIDISSAPARWIASVCDRFDLHPGDPAGAMEAGEQQAGQICELLNRDHEMRVAVDEATKRGGA